MLTCPITCSRIFTFPPMPPRWPILQTSTSYILSTEGIPPPASGDPNSGVVWCRWQPPWPGLPMVSRLRFTRATYPFQRINLIQCGRDKSHSPHARFQSFRSIAVIWPGRRMGVKIAFYQPSNPPDSNQEVIKPHRPQLWSHRNPDSPRFLQRPELVLLTVSSWPLPPVLSSSSRQLFVYDLASGDFTSLTPQPFQNVLISPNGPPTATGLPSPLPPSEMS